MDKMGSKANCGSVRKGSWTDEEDNLLRNCIEKHGEGNWHRVPIRAGLNRCRKSCRLCWMNYLKPNIKRGQFNEDEVDLIIRLHKLLGNRWSLIAGRIPGRTANDVKNYWNTHLLKKMCPNPKQPNNYNNNVCSKTTRTSSSTTTTTITTKKEGSNTASGIIIKPHAWSFAKQYGGEGGRSVVVSKSSSSVIENSEEEEEEEEQQQEDDKWWEKLVDIYEEKEKEKGKDDTTNNNNYNINNINNNNSTNNNDDVQHILHTAYSSWDDHLLWNLDLNVWDS